MPGKISEIVKNKDLIVAPLCEAMLIFIAGIAALAIHRPLLFASLGPTAYELTETPDRPSARLYNIIVGHLIGVLSGFAALAITHAWRTPPTSTIHTSMARVLASVLAALFTVFGTLLVRATQPAAVATCLLISTGALQQPEDGPIIMLSIIMIALLGEPVKRWRLRARRNS